MVVYKVKVVVLVAAFEFPFAYAVADGVVNEVAAPLSGCTVVYRVTVVVLLAPNELAADMEAEQGSLGILVYVEY